MKTKGFTLIEVILVVVILTVALGFLLLYTQTSQVRADANSQANTMVSYLRLGQSNALSGRTGKETSVHLDNSSYVNFVGSIYAPDDPSNFEIEFPPTITIENISLNGGGSDIIFSTPNGTTSTYGSFDLVASQINKTITINVSSLGNINY